MFNGREQGFENIFIKITFRECITISAIDNRGEEVLVEEIFENFSCHGLGGEGFVQKGDFVFPSGEVCRGTI